MSPNATTPTEPVISVTVNAARQIQHLLAAKPENAGKQLRVSVESGGCSGKQYGLEFDERRPGDLVAEAHGVTVLVDPASAEHLRGSVVDFNDGLNDSGFKIINPNARQSCGCGNSFET